MAAVTMAEAGWHPKREAKRFEPPPWERERFEALKQRPVEEQPSAPDPAAERAECVVPTPTGAAEALAIPEPEVSRVGDEAAVAKRAPAGKPLPIPEAQVDAMLLQLGAEEPRVDSHIKEIGLFGSVVAMILGVSMFAWGVFAMIAGRAQLAAVVGALIVMTMGLVFGTLGFVLGWRVTNKE